MSKKKSVLLWVLAVVIMAGLAVYQRMTGPTHPERGKVTINSQQIKFKLPRSHGGEGDRIIEIVVPDTKVTGKMQFRRYKSHDDWQEQVMKREGGKLIAAVPHQPPAGKVMYKLTLTSGKETKELTPQPVIIRFKGAVPLYCLLPHIFCAFMAMCFSTRTGFEAYCNGPKVYKMSITTIALLVMGTLVLGPIIQKYAFGAFWTGWPFGHDLTDNKSAVAVIAWGLALWKQRKGKNAQAWVIGAAIVLFAVFAIPHSALGSELDYTKMPQGK